MNSSGSQPGHAPTPRACLLTLALLALLLTGCAVQLPVPASESVPPLPAEAQRSKTPTFCLPSCSANAASLLTELQTSLDSLISEIRSKQPAKPATPP